MLVEGPRPPVPYDALSLDVGITPSGQGVPGALQHATPVKPVSTCVCCIISLMTYITVLVYTISVQMVKH